MHRFLRLQHHRHTGKLLAHRHTSYRALAVILVLAGGVIIGAQWTLRQAAAADTLYVLATVPAPLPSSAPTIDQPVDGSMTSDPTITVSGNCPVILPPVSVVVYNGAAVAGSAPCQADGTYSVLVTLTAGANSLVVKTVTITGGIGPASNSVSITYTPPAPAANAVGTTVPSPTSTEQTTTTPNPVVAEPLAIRPDKAFIVFGPNKKAIWTGSFAGGLAPYTVTIDWGDGTTDVYHNINTTAQEFDHSYSDMQPHRIDISVNDSAGAEARASFSAISPYAVPTSIGILRGSSSQSGVAPSTLFGIYGAYLFLLGIVGILWVRAHAAGYAYAPVRTGRPVAGSRKRR